MAKSFLLKDRHGRIHASLTQTDNAFFFRTKGDLFDSAILILSGEGGNKDSRRFLVCGDGKEHIYPSNALNAAHAAIVNQDGIVLYSDCFDAFTTAAPYDVSSECRHHPEDKTDTQQIVPAVSDMKRVFPQRRWPMHPCMPESTYVNGEWN